MRKEWLYGLVFVVGLFLGDKMNVLDNTVNPLWYSRYDVSEQTYCRPFDLHKEYRVNDNGELEVYFGDEKMYLVEEDLRVNKPNLFESVLESGEDVADEFESLWERFKDRYL